MFSSSARGDTVINLNIAVEEKVNGRLIILGCENMVFINLAQQCKA
jgi:hypothetical protein